MKIHCLITHATLVSLFEGKQDGLTGDCFLLKMDSEQTRLLAGNQLSNIPVSFPASISLWFEKNPGFVIDRSMAYDFLALTFHPAYLKSKNKPVIYSADNFSAEDIALLERLFTETGYAGVMLKNQFKYMKEGTAVNRITDAELASSVFNETDIIVEAGSVNEIADVRQIQEERERSFQAENPLLYAALLKLTLLAKELHRTAEDVYWYKEKSNAMEQFLLAQNTNGEAAQIQDFYNREYEALPVWYRKVGNLIKIMTGKRKLN